jgi:hypothetical protein
MINKKVKNARMIFAFMVPLTFAAFGAGYFTIEDLVLTGLSELKAFDYVSL